MIFLENVPGKQMGYFTTFVVVGAYSNIPREYGPETIEYWLDKFPESLHPRFSKESVLNLLHLD